VAVAWFNLQLGLIPTTAGYLPSVASRASGHSSHTVYEFLVNGMLVYQSFVGFLNEFKSVPQTESGKVY
jgi:hypothetical protein